MSDKLTIYHGGVGRPTLREIYTRYNDVAENAVLWTPDKITPTAMRWAYDNGAYSAHINDKSWDAQEWINGIMRAQRLIAEERMPRPDFAVLPGKVADREETYQRSEAYRRTIPSEWDVYFAVQDGMQPQRAVRFAEDLLCDGIFVGGTVAWKRTHAEEFVHESHARDLSCHVARPSLPDGLFWARSIGADSVDLSTIARHNSYHHLDTLRSQTQLGASD